MKTVLKPIYRTIAELKRPENVAFLTVLGLVMVLIWLKAERDKQSVLANMVETYATIKGFSGCYNNGKCVDFVYTYNGVEYSEDARVSWSFASWCEDRNFCRGKTFRLLLDSLNPENILVYWEEMYQAERANRLD